MLKLKNDFEHKDKPKMDQIRKETIHLEITCIKL